MVEMTGLNVTESLYQVSAVDRAMTYVGTDSTGEE